MEMKKKIENQKQHFEVEAVESEESVEEESTEELDGEKGQAEKETNNSDY